MHGSRLFTKFEVLKYMKDFNKWNKLKKNIDTLEKTRFYHPREIWWCSLGLNIGYEQDGKDEKYQRPVLVIKKFGSIALVVPLTSSLKEHVYRIPIGEIQAKPARVIISQMKVVDTKRFTEKMLVLEKSVFQEIINAIKNMF